MESVEAALEVVLYGKAESTKRYVRKVVRRFFRVVGKDPSSLTTRDVDWYVVSVLGDRRQTASELLLYLAKLFDYLGRRDLAEHCRQLKRGIRIPEYNRRRDFLRDDELSAVMRVLWDMAASPVPKYRAVAAAFLLMLFSGARLSEVLGLTAEDVRDNGVIVRVKGGRVEFKPVYEPRVVDLLRSLRPGRGGRLIPLAPRTLEDWFKRILRAAGLPEDRVKRLKPHDLRRTFALVSYRGTGDIMAVSEALGHRNVRTTMVYLGRGIAEVEAERKAAAARAAAERLKNLEGGEA